MNHGVFVYSIYLCSRPTCKNVLASQHKLILVETLKLVNYLWTKVRNLGAILDDIGDFGRKESEILDSMFV